MNSLLVAVCLALLTVACASAFAQSTGSSTKPITLKGLEDALKIGGLKDSELIGQIQSRGVDFILTPQITDALRQAWVLRPPSSRPSERTIAARKPLL